MTCDRVPLLEDSSSTEFYIVPLSCDICLEYLIWGNIPNFVVQLYL